MSKQYINEEKAKELFEEEFNDLWYCPIMVAKLYGKYEEEFQAWLEENEYHCQQKEYDKYEKETD